jgi:hypothetical protein
MRVPNALVGAAVRRCPEVVPIVPTLVGAAVVDHARDIRRPLGQASSDGIRPV